MSSTGPLSGDGQVDFEEFMTILGPKLLSSETREGFLGSTIDTIFWQVNLDSFQLLPWLLLGFNPTVHLVACRMLTRQI